VSEQTPEPREFDPREDAESIEVILAEQAEAAAYRARQAEKDGRL